MKQASVLLVFLLLCAGCAGKAPSQETSPSPSPTVNAEPLDKYSYRGTQCFELSLQLPVDAARARALVPAKYKVTEVQGRAVLVFAFARCDRMVPGGADRPIQVVQVDAAIRIEEGQYEIAYVTNSRSIAENATRTGLEVIYAPTATLLAFSLGTELVQVHVRAGNLSIDAEAQAARNSAPSTAGATYYQSGPNGTVRIVYDIAVQSIGPAAGHVSTQSGSPLAILMGASRADAAGFYASFGLGANITRLPG